MTDSALITICNDHGLPPKVFTRVDVFGGAEPADGVWIVCGDDRANPGTWHALAGYRDREIADLTADMLLQGGVWQQHQTAFYRTTAPRP